MAKDNKLIAQIVDRYDGEVGMLIPMMQDLQADRGYLPMEHLHCLSKRLDVPLSRIYAVVTFYSSNSLVYESGYASLYVLRALHITSRMEMGPSLSMNSMAFLLSIKPQPVSLRNVLMQVIRLVLPSCSMMYSAIAFTCEW